MTTPSRRDLSRRLASLTRQLDADLERVRVLGEAERRRDRVEELRDDLGRQLERVHEAAVVTLVGATGAGKSTLLNALVGRSIAIEGTDRPTTRRPVVYAPRDADLSRLLEGLPGEEPHIERYDGDGGGPWTDQVLIDAPDVNSIAGEHRDVVRALADRSDVLLVVLHRQSIVEEASVTFVDDFAKRRAMVFVLGRSDELTDAARAELMADMRRLASERFEAPDAKVVAISARQAQSDPSSPGWRELTDALSTFVRDGVLGGVRRHNALGTAAAMGDLFGELAPPLTKELEAVPGELDAGLLRLAETTSEEVALRLSLRRADLASLLWGETAKRWDGPGGWALRVGGLSGLGLGAGLLVARRHPLLAAGTAVGSLAASKIKNVVDKKRVSDPGELFPAGSEFESWYVDALGPARRRVARLTGSATGLGLPDSEGAAESLWPRVADAWNDLVQRDLPQASEKSAVHRMQFVLDAPVYALGLWVIYQAVVGYWSGDFLGVDFLVNTALIFFAYLFGVRTVCRRLLSMRAQSLLDRVIERSRQALLDAGGADRTAVEGEVRELAGALGRLAAIEERWRSELGAP